MGTASRLAVIFALCAMPVTGLAVTPRLINFQGQLTNSAGSPLSGSYSLTLKIYDAAVAGNAVWTETQTVTASSGAFSVLLGAVAGLNDSHFSDTSRYLGIAVGTDPELSPRIRLATSPYAFRVQTLDEANGGDIRSNLTLHGNLTIGDASGEDGFINMLNGANYTVHIGSSESGDNGGVIKLDNASNQTTVWIDADDPTVGDVGALVKLNDGGTNTIAFDAATTKGGEIALYDVSGDKTIGIAARGGTSGGGRLILADGGGDTTINLNGDATGAGLITVIDNSGGEAITLSGAYGVVVLDAPTTGSAIELWSDQIGSPGAELSMKLATGTEMVEILASETGTDGGQMIIRQGDGVSGIVMDGDEGTAGGGAAYFYTNGGTSSIEIDGHETDGAGAIRLMNAAGTTTITLDPEFSGDGRVITEVLQITGGSDLSEQFEISPCDPATDVQPGMIVCIDASHQGQLVVSNSPYDRTVAGIISGAGGVKSGMLMSQTGAITNGKYPVALTGRVYCLADATHGAISPGDLLTTSPTPGHAMKAGDPLRAAGAVIGKAMTSLAEGKGLVLVLVTLQ